jgi:DNA-binding SARP family transcriptional activator
MRCQAASGERGWAIRHYEELVELLDVQSGTAPAPETRALRERLRAGEDVRAFFRRKRLTAFSLSYEAVKIPPLPSDVFLGSRRRLRGR